MVRRDLGAVRTAVSPGTGGAADAPGPALRAGLALLAALARFGSALGLGLGVNLTNALVLGLLGAPGFALLCLLHWALGKT